LLRQDWTTQITLNWLVKFVFCEQRVSSFFERLRMVSRAQTLTDLPDGHRRQARARSMSSITKPDNNIFESQPLSSIRRNLDGLLPPDFDSTHYFSDDASA
jgi:hypothetical protein